MGQQLIIYKISYVSSKKRPTNFLSLFLVLCEGISSGDTSYASELTPTMYHIYGIHDTSNFNDGGKCQCLQVNSINLIYVDCLLHLNFCYTSTI